MRLNQPAVPRTAGASVPTLISEPSAAVPRWHVVPATAANEQGFTIEDYEVAALDLERIGDDDLAAKARDEANAMRAWLLLMEAHAATNGGN